MTRPDTEHSNGDPSAAEPFDLDHFGRKLFAGDEHREDDHREDEHREGDHREDDHREDERVGAEGGAAGAPGARRGGGQARFPGGAARLPRISKPGSTDPDLLFVESAFFKESQMPWPESTPLAGTGFGQYYSTQSLFDTAPDLFAEPDEQDGPYAVLGLTRRANWAEISKAHRKLVSELHPDRYVDADEVVREAAERRVRDVNEAYAEIRRERAVGQ